MAKIQESDEIVSLCAEAILYGLYLQTFFRCIRALLRWKSKQSGVATALIVISLSVLLTLDVVLAIERLRQMTKYSEAPTRHLSHTIPWYNVVKTSAVAFCSLLVDGVLIFRCWIVYGRRWAVIAASLLLWIGGLVMVIWAAYAQSHLGQASHYHKKTVDNVYTGFWCLTIVMNILTTTLIVRRIQAVAVSTKRSTYSAIRSLYRPETALQRVIGIVVESGLLCTTSSLFVFLSQAVKSDYLYLASAVMIMMTGISFNLMTIRVERGRRKMEKWDIESAPTSCATGTLRFSSSLCWGAVTQTTASSVADKYGEKMTFEIPHLEKGPVAHPHWRGVESITSNSYSEECQLLQNEFRASVST